MSARASDSADWARSEFRGRTAHGSRRLVQMTREPVFIMYVVCRSSNGTNVLNLQAVVHSLLDITPNGVACEAIHVWQAVPGLDYGGEPSRNISRCI